MAARVYTKGGDYGTTSLGFHNLRIPKSHPVFDLLGTLDELNAHLGLCMGVIAEETSLSFDDVSLCYEDLQKAQTELYIISGNIHTNCILENLQQSWLEYCYYWLFPPNLQTEKEKQSAESQLVQNLQTSMDQMSKQLEPLTKFLRPVGPPLISNVQITRTICRKAERSFVEARKSYKMNWKDIDNHAIYLNRLSDYLFVLARYLSKLTGIAEETF